MEVWSKGGFLRSDTHIGTASMKLAPLETTCMIHDSFDLYDGRKAVGGKVSLKSLFDLTQAFIVYDRLKLRSELEMEYWLNKSNKFKKSGLLSSFDKTKKCDVSLVIYDLNSL